jgi:hypothetical protein
MTSRARKYIEYPAFAEFVASDSDLFVLRRFNRLNARVLLRLQDELVILEDQLNDIDCKSRARDAGDVNNGSFREDPIEERVSLLADMSVKLREYSK